MLKFLFFPLVACFIFLINACDKDTDSCNLAPFTGIAGTDVNGNQLGDDTDDWTFDDPWNIIETDLFDDPSYIKCLPSFDYWIIAYPNPVPDYNQSILFLAVGKDSTTTIDIRIVDENCTTLFSINGLSEQNVLFDLKEYKGETLRMYYRLIRGDCELHGHGDIEVEE